MEFIIIGILFVIQLLSLFWIAILNTKLNKVKDLELQQQKVIAEMDNSIGAYLLEMKDENDRLLQEIQAMSKQQVTQSTIREQHDVAKSTITETAIAPIKVEKPVAHIPKVVAATAYEKQIEKEPASFEQTKVSSILNQGEIKPLTFEQKVKQMSNEGLTIEQIAKKTNKGKTEIELLLKFST